MARTSGSASPSTPPTRQDDHEDMEVLITADEEFGEDDGKPAAVELTDTSPGGKNVVSPSGNPQGDDSENSANPHHEEQPHYELPFESTRFNIFMNLLGWNFKDAYQKGVLC